jgi:hypothetical protein
MFIAGEFVIGTIEIVFILVDVGSEINLEPVFEEIYFCYFTTTVWSF